MDFKQNKKKNFRNKLLTNHPFQIFQNREFCTLGMTLYIYFFGATLLGVCYNFQLRLAIKF